jgi:CheY-like chemotaxis protein
VVLNLAVNARDAMPEGGRLTIDAASVTLDDAHVRRHADTAPGPHVCITVSDTGCGMNAETLARVFEPFYTTKDAGHGTGLGLAAVYGIVRGWGGHVAVESEPGRGATFRIYLPQVALEIVPGVPPVEATVADAGVPGPIPRGDETLLLVEDEATVRDTAAEILRECGYQVLEARDGADALHVAERYQGPIHVLVSDVVMPNMSGGELARALSAERPGLRVLFVSGYAADEQVRESVRHHAVAFLQKPFSIEGLARAVRHALETPPADRAA